MSAYLITLLLIIILIFLIYLLFYWTDFITLIWHYVQWKQLINENDDVEDRPLVKGKKISATIDNYQAEKKNGCIQNKQYSSNLKCDEIIWSKNLKLSENQDKQDSATNTDADSDGTLFKLRLMIKL